MNGRTPFWLFLCSVLLALPALADVIHLDDGGKHRGTITKESRRSVTIETGVGSVVVRRDRIVRIERKADPRGEFLKRYKKLKAKPDADGFVELGEWAQTQKLEKEARRCYRRALKVDAFHQGARKALGHKQYEGRWYSPEDYEQVSQGKVEHEGQWVTPAEKAKLERGLVQDASGKWIDPNAPKRTVPASTPKPASPWFRRRPAAPRPVATPPAKKKGNEDTAWYYDNTSSGPLATAPETESRYYKIKSNVKPEYAKRYGKMMDRYYGKFLKVFKAFLPKGELPKGNIWIYASRDEFRRSEGVGPTTGGYYRTGVRRVVAFHGPFGNSGHTREVLAHEGTHQFEDFVLGGRGFRNCPIWILEGLAVLFESAVYDGDKVVVGLVPQDRLSSLKRGLASGTLIPLRQLIRTPQPSFTAYHYAHAWSLIYMILYSSESKSVRKKTNQWFADLFTLAKTQRVSPAEVIERCGGEEKFTELEERWKAFIRDLEYDYDPR